jgi:hypothetical protein
MTKKNGKRVNLRGKAPAKKVKVLQSLLSCLFYLCQEAERERLPYVGALLKDTISRIDLLSRSGVLPHAGADIIDDSLYEAMSFLHELAGLSPAQRSDFMKTFEILRHTLRVEPVRPVARKEGNIVKFQ